MSTWLTWMCINGLEGVRQEGMGKLGRERGADLEKLTLGLWGPAGRGRWEVLCLKSI